MIARKNLFLFIFPFFLIACTTIRTKTILTEIPTDNANSTVAPTIPQTFTPPLSASETPKSVDGQVAIYIPKDLEDCFAELERLINPDDLQIIKTGSEEDMMQYHFSLGMWMRNNWGLWSGSRLSQWFIDRGITNPDDMSSIILISFWRYLNNRPINLEEQIKYYQDYWKEVNQQEKPTQPLPNRIISVLAWEDSNKDGFHQPDEKPLYPVNICLAQIQPETGDKICKPTRALGIASFTLSLPVSQSTSIHYSIYPETSTGYLFTTDQQCEVVCNYKSCAPNGCRFGFIAIKP